MPNIVTYFRNPPLASMFVLPHPSPFEVPLLEPLKWANGWEQRLLEMGTGLTRRLRALSHDQASEKEQTIKFIFPELKTVVGVRGV